MRTNPRLAKLRAIRDDLLRERDIPDDTIEHEVDFDDAPDDAFGDVGFPCFALAPHLKASPEQIAEQLAEPLEAALADLAVVGGVEPVGPYLNVAWDRAELAHDVVTDALSDGIYGEAIVDAPERWMIEFSAPNTNKPLHVGHTRNNLLGESLSEIADFAGHDVTRTNLINDRGIHICKSMVAYQLDDEAETPAIANEKGDHFVGRYYVKFNDMVEDEYEQWQQTDAADEAFAEWVEQERRAGRLSDDDLLDDQRDQLRESFFDTYRDEYFNRHSDLGQRARQMLQQWEAGDDDVVQLWETMNNWVLGGFRQTYERMGVRFDRIDRESKTYERGRATVEEGLEKGVSARLDDGAVVFDLEKIGMEGQKVVLRSDGTTVYITQDLGTATLRFEEFPNLETMIYVVGDEQDYHFQVLFGILQTLRPDLEDRLEHLSYGMVDLPEGKMKSREGKVVDADDLMDEMVELAGDAVEERYNDLDADEIRHRAEVIGRGALKFHLLDFKPRTNIQFNPEESIDFQGRTGPYCQYTYARIQSIGRKIGGWPALSAEKRDAGLRALGTDREAAVVDTLADWRPALARAVHRRDPSYITEYLFELAGDFASLYNDDDHRIMDLDGPRRHGLLLLAQAVAHTLETGLDLLGIETLDEM